MAPSAVEQKVLKQVEFYFSDSNLPGDKFMLPIVKANDGWFEIATLLKFNRLKKICDDNDTIVSALRQSESLLEVNEEGTKVRRTAPLPERMDRIKAWIYAKGFPEDSTIETVTEFFEKVGKVGRVDLRRTRDQEKKFKGSVFVKFSSEEEAQKVAAMELTAPNSEEKLEMMTKADWSAKKSEEIKAKKSGGASKKEEPASKKRKQETEKEAEPAEEKVEYTKDLIIQLTGCAEGSQREDIKELLESADAKVAYVDFSRGDTDGYARLDTASALKAADTVAKLTEAKTEMKGVVPTLKALSGEEEEQYWIKVNERKKNRPNKKGGRGKRQRRN
jgi:lupus La protein